MQVNIGVRALVRAFVHTLVNEFENVRAVRMSQQLLAFLSVGRLEHRVDVVGLGV